MKKMLKINNIDFNQIFTNLNIFYSKKFLLLIFLLLNTENLLSQPYFKKSEYSFGVNSSINLINENIYFSQLPNVPNCCQEFTSGSGMGYNFGLYFQKKIMSQNYMNLKIGYSAIYSHLTSDQTEFIEFNNQLYSALIEHKVNTIFKLFYIEPTYKFVPVDNFGLILGANAGYLTSTTFDQAEYLIKPENTGTFSNGRRVRNERSGTIPEIKSLLIFLTVGLEYDFVLDEFSVYHIAPFINLNYGLNSLFSDREWKTNSISIGFNFFYNPFIEISTPLKPEQGKY